MVPTRTSFLLRSLLVLAVTLATALRGQDVRELSTPVPRLHYTGVTTATIGTAINSGYRLVDLEYRGYNLFGSVTYDAVLVQNTGQYATNWWWYHGITSGQVTSFLSSNNARLIDLEPYEDPNGNLRFACIMVDNTGANQKVWWWYYGTTTANLGTLLAANNARLIDLDSYVWNGTTYYSGVMIRNTGADQRTWWWYVNVSTAQITGYINSNQARLYDLERRANGNWDCVMIAPVAAVAWYWWVDLQAADIATLQNNYGVRAIDIESYLVGTSRRWAMVAINNSNYLTTNVGNGMRNLTDGTVGCWLQEINGANLADLNGTAEFEPASTMKTLHHVHALRQVATNQASLTMPITVFTAYSPTNPSCPVIGAPVTEQLHVVLRDMMENSDNARTQAITTQFGENAINATAVTLNMGNTDLNHTLGCAADAIANPNTISLRDLHWLHEQVANGYISPLRNAFYDLMREDLADLDLDTVINAEGTSLGLSAPTIASFRAFTKLAHKGGSYTLNSGTTYHHRAEFGWISIPFITNDVITPREYSFGAFVNGASNGTAASNAVWIAGVPELLRSTIRQAMMSWNNSLAGILSIGAGCGSPAFTQSVTGLPRLGASVFYHSQNGLPNSIAFLVVGLSSTSWGGTPLPVSMELAGSAPGCLAYNDYVFAFAAFGGPTGQASFQMTLPFDTSSIGLRYMTQCYSFGATPFLTSNAYRNIVGF